MPTGKVNRAKKKRRLSKAPKADAPAAELLSPELRASLGLKDGDDAQVCGVVTTGTKQTSGAGSGAAAKKKPVVPMSRAERRRSKSQMKKLARLEAEKAKKARRAEVLASIEQMALPAEHQAVMLPSSGVGGKQTLKQRLTLQLRKQRLGLLDEDGNPTMATASTTTDATHADDGEGSERPVKRRRKRADKALVVTKARPSEPVAPPAAQPPANINEGAGKAGGSDDSDSDGSDDSELAPITKNASTFGFTVAIPNGGNADGSGDADSTPAADPTAQASSPAPPPAPGGFGFSVSIPAKLPSAAAEVAPAADGDDGTADKPSQGDSALASLLEDDEDVMLKRLKDLKRRNAELKRAAPMSAAQQRRAAIELSEQRDAELEQAPKKSIKHYEVVDITAGPLTANFGRRKRIGSTTAPIRFVVTVKRDPRIQEKRMQLPVCAAEQEIMEAITLNDVVIICGETGSGKTTQVPQFLYEAGYGCKAGIPGLVAVTQPRRVAAIAMAERVATELNVPCSKKGHVGYQIRYDTSTVGKKTRVKFMTDGILMREIQEDLLLRKYSCIVLDEAHERNMNTDVLIGLLSRALPFRNEAAKTDPTLTPLKLVIMSATLRVTDFTENALLFPRPPPVIKISARQFPVTVHFSRRTELVDYVGDAFAKVVKIHRRLPDGGVLVFLTGKQEIDDLVDRLRRRFQRRKRRRRAKPALRDGEAPPAAGADTPKPTGEGEGEGEGGDADKDDSGSNSDSSGEGSDGDGERDGGDDDHDGADKEANGSDSDSEEEYRPVHVLPLYAMLPRKAQQAVFRPPPAGHRLVVVATNVAETSVTIPGIRYVVDTGRVKRRVYNTRSGTSKFEVSWVSQASADQRTGRAGRTGPGHCYRLYSSAVFAEKFPKFEEAEVLTKPIESMVLQMKSMGIQSVERFPFPSPPRPDALQTALRCLVNIGALERHAITDDAGTAQRVVEMLTPLGEQLVKLPLHPRLGKMLVLGGRELLPYTVATVAAFSVQNPFIHPRFPRLRSKKKAAAGGSKDDEDVEARAAAAAKGLLDDGSDSDDTDVGFGADHEAEDQNQVQEMERRRRIVEAAREAHGTWDDPTSDALTLLNAVGALSYVDAGEALAFCRNKFLHHKTMMEINSLRKQLHHQVTTTLAVFSISGKLLRDDGNVATGSLDAVEVEATDDGRAAASLDGRTSFRHKLLPPSEEQQDLVRQAVTAGLIDHVAMRAPPELAVQFADEARGRVVYLSCDKTVTGALFIHPRSAVFSRMARKMPQFVAYRDVTYTTRSYMQGVTVVDPDWLPALSAGTPLCRFSGALPSPEPRYNADRDTIMCAATPAFGDRGWELKATMIPHPDTPARRRWFARCLLEGKVLPVLSQLVPYLAGNPAQITRKAIEKRVMLFVEALEGHNPPVDSKATLVAAWRRNPRFLLREYMLWVTKDQHSMMSAIWAKVVKATVGEAPAPAPVAGAGAGAGAGASASAPSKQGASASKTTKKKRRGKGRKRGKPGDDARKAASK